MGAAFQIVGSPNITKMIPSEAFAETDRRPPSPSAAEKAFANLVVKKTRVLCRPQTQELIARRKDLLDEVDPLTAQVTQLTADVERLKLVAGLKAASETAGEGLWPMPIPEEMYDRVHSSKVADLAQHDWVRWGGGLYAAAFLREFTDGLPWGHLDVAGPAFNTGGPSGHVPSGGTGFGLATLLEFVRAHAPA